MKNKNLLMKVAKCICLFAGFVAPFASEYCRGLFYQPTEPENLSEFVTDNKKRAK